MIAEAITPAPTKSEPLLIEDYPYSFRLRCQMRVWVEEKKDKGFRVVRQTSNPKRPGTWNKPKASTYSLLGVGLYRDEEGHVHHVGIGEYSEPAEIADFVERWGTTADITQWCRMKARLAYDFADGRRFFTINGKSEPLSDAAKDRHEEESAGWDAIVAKLEGSNV